MITLVSEVFPQAIPFLIVLAPVLYVIYLAITTIMNSRKGQDTFNVKVLDLVSTSLDDIRELKEEVDQTRKRLLALETALLKLQRDVLKVAEELPDKSVSKKRIARIKDDLLRAVNG
jgi:F0F1-type ATP synthase membrane subunit b/b'